MAGKVEKGWNVSSPINLAFLALLILLAVSAIGLSLIDLFGLPLFFNDAATMRDIEALPPDAQFSFFITDANLDVQPLRLQNSPYNLNVTINTPALTEDHDLRVLVVANGKILSKTDCLKNDKINYTGMTRITCLIPLKYNYLQGEDAKIYATIEDQAQEVKSLAPAIPVKIDWQGYEGTFWTSAGIVLVVAIICLVVVFTVGAAMLFFSTRIQHEMEYEDEYSMLNILLPLKNAKGFSQRFQAFISSPIFWGFELFGIFIILLYLAVSVEFWRSPAAIFAFFISGVLAFITPFLWVAFVWFADYKEREPLRIIVSLFLWGGFSCLMAIGVNSIAGLFFMVCGLSFLTASFIAPISEELFKGTGLAVFSFHHEYDNMVDGILYGFVIGMGFSFVENWLYFLKNPMGGDIWGWMTVMVLRSIVFSANHGVFTAFIGGVIGLLKQWKFPYATLGLAAGMIPAMLLHALHNSGEIWITFLGLRGICAYCCCIIPAFDYGGLILVALLLIGGVLFTQGKKKEVLPPPEPVKQLIEGEEKVQP